MMTTTHVELTEREITIVVDVMNYMQSRMAARLAESVGRPTPDDIFALRHTQSDLREIMEIFNDAKSNLT